MPHISIKHFPKALTQEQKNYLSEMITITIQDVFQCDKSVISIATEA
ncbi:4-oxalocrotonate tautomerase, partial [Vibrio agarivorans]